VINGIARALRVKSFVFPTLVLGGASVLVRTVFFFSG
jgi:hypothetical protein